MMKTHPLSPRLPALALSLLFGAVATLIVAHPQPARAGASSWKQSMGGEVRLISSGGPLQPDGTLSAGIHLRLKEGWHTYWRFPGDSGIPPSADFSGSLNLASATIGYPVPQRITDAYSTSIGYETEVVLPIAVTPDDPASPVLLKLSLTYGVCEEICVPLVDEMSLVMAATGPADPEAATLIADARAQIPQPAQEGDPLSVTDVSLAHDPKRFVFHARLPEPAAPSDLFVEGPEGSYLSVPDRDDGDGSAATWTLPYDGLVHDGETATLRLTLVNGGQAVEQNWVLDADWLDRAASAR